MKYVIRAIVFPFLLIGYFFYFMHYKIFEYLGAAIDKADSWEIKTALYIPTVLLIVFSWFGYPLILSIFIFWELMMLSAPCIPLFVCAIVGLQNGMDGEMHNIFTPAYIGNLIFPPRPKLPNPYENDPDYRAGLDTEAEFGCTSWVEGQNWDEL